MSYEDEEIAIEIKKWIRDISVPSSMSQNAEMINAFKELFINNQDKFFIACLRREERRNNKMSNNKIEKLLDKYYLDEYIDNIFNNARQVK